MKKIILSLALISSAIATPTNYLVYDFGQKKILEQKNIDEVRSIASLTKLMTAHVFLSLQKGGCISKILPEDRDTLKYTKTRLPQNVPISCDDLLRAMLISSDNYAASALSHSVKGVSKSQFIAIMNKTAKRLGMKHTRFYDSSGLNPNNKSTAKDLLILSQRVMGDAKIRAITSTPQAIVMGMNYPNTNALVRYNADTTVLSKTGYIQEAGYNLIYVRDCNKKIGIVSLNNPTSNQRVSFAHQKISHFCANQDVVSNKKQSLMNINLLTNIHSKKIEKHRLVKSATQNKLSKSSIDHEHLSKQKIVTPKNAQARNHIDDKNKMAQQVKGNRIGKNDFVEVHDGITRFKSHQANKNKIEHQEKIKLKGQSVESSHSKVVKSPKQHDKNGKKVKV